jgi:hypothetical protein
VLSEFKGATQVSHPDVTTASARLPGLDIEIVHRPPSDGESEQLSIRLQATPSFEAFGGFAGTFNPFAYWVEAVQLAWSPWLNVAGAMLQPWSLPLLPGVGTDAASRSTSGQRFSG